MRLFRPSFLIEWVFPEIIFRITTGDKILCLTFDDGPNPGSTPKILELLERYDIKAVFFCNGMSAEEYPDLVDSIKDKGHIIGNHGYAHLNGWVTSLKDYINDIAHASEYTSDKLFRPPYGRLRISQYKLIKKTFKIMLWDIMPYDFDYRYGREKSLELLKKKIRPGSVIVLHDNPGSTVLEYLNDFILFASGKKYRFTIPDF